MRDYLSYHAQNKPHQSHGKNEVCRMININVAISKARSHFEISVASSSFASPQKEKGLKRRLSRVFIVSPAQPNL